jgi:hypothetical protein
MDGFTLGHEICHTNLMFSRRYGKIQKESLQMFKLPHANTWCVNRREAKIMWVGQHCSLVSLTALKALQQKHGSLPFQSHDPQFKWVVLQFTKAKLIKSWHFVTVRFGFIWVDICTQQLILDHTASLLYSWNFSSRFKNGHFMHPECGETFGLCFMQIQLMLRNL